MEINRSNYEALLLDLAEGKLTSAERERLLEFLASHPDCDPGTDLEELVFLPDLEINFPGKELMKKAFPDSATRLSTSNFDLFSIARLEGDLTAGQTREHEAYISGDDLLKRDWEQWHLTKLAPVRVPFPHRSRLKHRQVLTGNRTWIGILAAAAAIALMIVVLARREDQAAPLLSGHQVRLPEIGPRPVSVPVSPPLEREKAALVSPLPEKRIPPPDSQDMETGRTAVVSTESSVQASIAEQAPGTMHVPLRISRFAHVEPAPLWEGTYDRIRPLDLPPSRVHQNGITLSRVAEMGLQEWVSEVAQERDFSFWTIADAGIRGINRVTGSNMDLVASRDEEGEVSGFRFKSRMLTISTPLEKSE